MYALTLNWWQEGEYLDLDERDMIVLRVRGDGRKYIVSIRTDNWVISGTNHDVWQAFLFAPCAPGRLRRVPPDCVRVTRV